MWPPVGSVRAPVEHADVVQSQEPALEHVAAFGVLAIHPPREVQHQLVEHAFQERDVALAAVLLAVDLEHAPRGPGVHRRIHVAERPLVRRHLAVRVHVPLAREQHELVLGELRIDERQAESQWNARSHAAYHGYSHLSGIEITSALFRCAHSRLRPCLRLSGGGGVARVAVQPFRHVVIEELLAPDHAGEGLALHVRGVIAVDAVLQRRVELVGLAFACRDHAREVRERLREALAGAGARARCARRPPGSSP